MKFEYIDEPVSRLEYLDEEKPSNAARIGKEFADYGKKVGSSIANAIGTGASIAAEIPLQAGAGLYGLGTLLSGQGLDKAAAATKRVQDKNFVKAAAETALTLGSGTLSGLYGPMVFAAQRLQGTPDKVAEQMMGEAMENATYTPRSELGQEWAGAAGEFVNRYLLPMSGVHIPTAGGKLPGVKSAVEKNIKEFPRASEVPEPIKTESPRAAPKFEYIDDAELDLGAQLGRKNQINAEQIAKLEAAIAKQNTPMPTIQVDGNGVARFPEAPRPIEQLTNELTQTELFDQPEMGRVANPYEAKLGDWRIDENGMPIKADLSMELANLEQPLQRNLWGDELERTRNPVGQAATLFDQNGLQEGVPLTQAIDSMPWAQRRGAIKRELTGAVEPSGELLGAMARARREFGAFDPAVFKEGFEKIKDVTFGKLRAWSDGVELHVTATDKNGNFIGRVSMSPEEWADPKPTNNLVSNWTESYRPGTAREMYKFVSELGNDIQRSKDQSPFGAAMWDKWEASGFSKGGVIPRSNKQRGALDMKEISDAVAKLTKPLDNYVNSLAKINISKVVPKDAQDYASNIPGMSKLLDGVIPRPKLDIDAALANSKDIPPLKSDVQSGPEMVGEKYRNPIVAGVSKYLQWADKKFDYANRTMVKPVERVIANLSPKMMIDLAEGLKSEMFARTQNADMFTGKAKEAYEALRREFDNVYNIQVAILQKQGRKIPTKQEAYLASLRNGNYHVNVKDSKGNTAWHIQATSKWEANQAINWLTKNVDGINKDMVVEYRNPNTLPGVPRDILGGFQELMNLIDGGSDASLAIKQAIKEATEQAGYKSLGQNQRFLEKANIRGFEGDMPWLSPEANAKRLLQSQIDYINNAYKWSYLNDALTDVKEVLSNERVLAEQPNAAGYVKDVVRAQLGLEEHLARNAEEYVMSSMGLSRSQLTTASGKLGRLTSLIQLGASTGYMIATPLTALYSVAQHTRAGTLGVKPMLNALTDMSAGIVNLMMDENASRARLPMTELGKEALKYAADNGIVTKNMFGDLDAIDRSRTVSRALQAYETTITFPERLQRLSTFMSFVHGLKEKGGYSNMYDLFQRAETLTNIAATNFRASEQPIIINKAGTIGGAAFKYKAPILNYYNQLHMTAMDAGKGNTKPLMALLGMTAVLGGIQNLPGINELDGIWNLTKDAVAKLSPQNYKLVKDIDVKDFIRQNTPEIAANGVVQEALGAQMSQRFGTDLLNIEDPLKNMFPAAGMAENLVGAAGSLLKGNPTQAAWNVSPQIVRGNMETRMEDFKGLQPGSYRKPSEISNTDIQQIRTPEDEAYRKWGLRSAEEAKRMETSALVNKEQMRIKTALDKSMNSLVKNLIDGDQKEVEKYAQAWLGLNPDKRALEFAIKEKLKRATLSPEQRELANARSIMAIQKIQRLRNARQ